MRKDNTAATKDDPDAKTLKKLLQKMTGHSKHDDLDEDDDDNDSLKDLLRQAGKDSGHDAQPLLKKLGITKSELLKCLGNDRGGPSEEAAPAGPRRALPQPQARKRSSVPWLSPVAVKLQLPLRLMR